MIGIPIGRLRQRLILEEPIRTPDEGGGVSVGWSPVAELWAQVRPISGGESASRDRITGSVSHEIVIRKRTGTLPTMRLRQDGRCFEILAVIDYDDERRFQKCLVEERDL